MSRGMQEIFDRIPDPRKGNAILHKLSEALIIAVLSVMCGMEYFTEMEMFAIEQEEWLKKFLELRNGVPSHDTFGDIFAVIEPEAITEVFTEWTETLREKIDKEVIGIDGKSICASRDVPKKKKAVHMVSAWATQNRLILGEVATSEKSNEITAIPQLLEMLELTGCIVTIDAMGTQTKIVEKIIEKGADYVLPVKENQPQLLQDIRLYFDDYNNSNETTQTLETAQTMEKDHGRIEKRECIISKDIDWLDPEGNWKNLAGIAKITSTTEMLSTGVVESSEQYLIFSARDLDAAQVLDARRAHWGVESMHWSLDVCLREDECRVRTNHAAKIFNIVRHFVMNLLSRESSSKGGISSKRKRCALSSAYREKCLRIS